MRAIWILLLVLYTLMTFRCDPPCLYNTEHSSALTKHQRTCGIHHAALRRTGEQRAEALRQRAKEEQDARERAAAEATSRSETIGIVDIGANVIHTSEPSTFTAPDTNMTQSGRPARARRLPRRFEDFIPSASAHVHPVHPVRPAQAPELDVSQPSEIQPPELPRHPIVTKPNEFGVFREYPDNPTCNPDEGVSLSEMAEIPAQPVASEQPPSHPPPTAGNKPWYHPFSSPSRFRIMNWMFGENQSAKKSVAELQSLVDNVILADDFSKDDFRGGYNAQREAEKLDAARHGEPSEPADGSDVIGDWRTASVDIRIPDGKRHAREEDNPIFTIPGLFYRPLLDIVRSALADTSSSQWFHWFPFRKFWMRDGGPNVRVYDELYSSDAFIQEHENIQKLRKKGDLEHCILGFMFWSDSTHLAQFGDASLWPIYLFFANQPKWLRAKLTGSCAHHAAYIPKLPDMEFQNFILRTTGKAATAEMLAHARRELMQAVWKTMFDDDFMHAYKHGIKLTCADGIERLIFPRIFTYSADYPEKVMVASLRSLADCPCSRCLIPKTRAHEMGTAADLGRRTATARTTDHTYISKIKRAREFVYQQGYGVASAAVDRVLKPESLTPTLNTFVTCFAGFGLNVFSMLVPDIMHEFELGIFKAVFIHLLRILRAAGGDLIIELNRRYRKVPTFGRDTIRRFSPNVAALKQLGARDFEDLLQCAIPVFEDLLPAPHNDIILTMLYVLAEWHALGKLRQHTDHSLALLEETTTSLGSVVRKFKQTTCAAYVTVELPREVAVRGRRNARRDAAATTTTDLANLSTAKVVGKRRHSTVHATRAAKRKTLNLNTPKWHFLPDYPATIRRVGTTDGYSTQRGEAEHRRVKRYYGRTNKNNATRQIAKQERRTRLLKRIKREDPTSSMKSAHLHVIPHGEHEQQSHLPPEEHHSIAKSQNHPFNIQTWLRDHAATADPALQDFLPHLRDHLLLRRLGKQWDGDDVAFSDAERQQIHIKNNLLYRHQTLRVNYTTYDMTRKQDTVNPHSHPDVMVLAHDDDSTHPFWYARVLGIFHANVAYVGSDPSIPGATQRTEFLWVRWFGRDHRREGRAARRLHRVGFVPENDPTGAFGFLDPRDVVRAVHLIPAFAHGRTSDLLRNPKSIARLHQETDDWRFYYVNQFVDRDMAMRFLGGAIGHLRVPCVNATVEDDEDAGVNPPDVDVNNPATGPGLENEDDEDDEDEDWADVEGDDASDSSDSDSDEEENEKSTSDSDGDEEDLGDGEHDDDDGYASQ